MHPCSQPTTKGIQAPFDQEAREILSGRRHIGQFSQKIFYWLSCSTSLCVVRDVATTEHFFKKPVVANLIKFRPMAFLVADSPNFHGHFCLNDFFTLSDTKEVNLPISRRSIDNSPIWPAAPGETGAVLMGQTTALVASASWRNSAIIRVR